MKSYLEKLRAKDRRAIDKLASLTEWESETYRWVFQWERQSLGLSADEETRVGAATSALAAMELLDLAENMKTTAKELPFTGGLSRAARDNLESILEKSRQLNFESSMIEAQFGELSHLYYTSGQEQLTQPRQQLRPPINITPQQAIQQKTIGTADDINMRLRKTLLECCKDTFETNKTVKVFMNRLMSQWGHDVPDNNDTESSRVISFINFLYKQYHSETRENGLVIALKVLSTDINHRNLCHQQLLALSQEVERISPGTSLVDQNVINALHTSHQLVVVVTNTRIEASNANSPLDAWDTAALKRHLHVLSESVAQSAKENAIQASSRYAYDLLEILVPLMVDLRWQRGYASGLQKLLRIPVPQKYLNEFHCDAVDPPSPVQDGVVSAERTEAGDVLVKLDGHAVVLVHKLTSVDMQVVVDSVNSYGRLGASETDGLSLLERIGQIPINATVSSGIL